MAAVVQAGSVFMDKSSTLEKALDLIAEAARNGAKIVVFPEAFLSGYPRGLGFGTVVGSRSDAGRELFARYHESAVAVPGKCTEALSKAAKQAGIFLVMGVVEKDAACPKSTLYCSLLFFGPDGALLGKHRKIKPTAAERIIWGEGDGSTLKTYDTPWGKIGGLVCWENYMPQARLALYRQGLDIYLAPTADNRDSWQATIRHIACEGRVFVMACNQFITKNDYPQDLRKTPELANSPEPFCRGGSAIIDPLGDYAAGPLYGEEGVLYAEIDHQQLIKARFDFDVTGHYARPDLFDDS